MITLKEQLQKIIFSELSDVNGEATEEELNMIISEKVAQKNINDIKEHMVIEHLESEPDMENIEMNGAYIYKYESPINWEFIKYNTIASAVRDAIKMLDAIVICNGNIISYDTYDDNTAYYLDSRSNKVKIVAL